jgi:hypothetical protein
MPLSKIISAIINRGILKFFYAFFFILLLVNHLCLAQTGPGGIEKNDGSTALKLWLDASSQVFNDTLKQQVSVNGDRIKSWGDRSGNKIKTTILNDNQRPTLSEGLSYFNNESALLFTRSGGTTNAFNALHTGAIPGVGNITIYCIFNSKTPPGGNDITPASASGDSPNSWYYGAGLVDADMPGIQNDFGLGINNLSIAAGAGDQASTKDYTIKTGISMNQTYMGSMVLNSTNGKMDLYTNGSNQVSINGFTAPRDPIQQITIGATNGNSSYPTNYFDGYIANILVFNKALNNAEQVILNNYLTAKYAINLLTMDYYTMDDQPNGNYDYDVAGIGMAADGTSLLDAKGEGIIEMSNPRTVANDRFLFWGHNNISLDEIERTDVPDPKMTRLKRTWRVSEIKGDLGGVDVKVELKNATPDMASHIGILFDTNMNGKFSDDTASIIQGAKHVGGNTFLFSNVNFTDRARFTFAVYPQVFTEEKNLTLTPNGDGNNDEYYIKEPGITRIFDKNGLLVKEFNCPCSWNGTNINGDLVTTGFYLIKFANEQSINITVIR